MTIRLYLDADAMRWALVEALRMRGIDVDTALEAGQEDDSDEAQLAYAAAQGRVLYSFNIRDFMRLHTAYQTEGQTHAGLILAPQQRYSAGRTNAPLAPTCRHHLRRRDARPSGISERVGIKHIDVRGGCTGRRVG